VILQCHIEVARFCFPEINKENGTKLTLNINIDVVRVFNVLSAKDSVLLGGFSGEA